MAKISWWDPQKGFGFTEVDGKRIFVHSSVIVPKSYEGENLAGQEIEIGQVVKSDKGLRAERVRRKIRLFSFSTKRSVRNTFRGSARDPEVGGDPEGLGQRARKGYRGLYTDELGEAPIDPDGFTGYMSESRLREFVKAGITAGVTFHLPTKQPFHGLHGIRYEDGWEDLGAVSLVRRLDNLSSDQCPVCGGELVRGEGFGTHAKCKKCGWS